MVPEDYVHRIGRTGRAGWRGGALAGVRRRARSLRAIEGVLGRRIDVLPLDRSAINFQPEPTEPVLGRGVEARPPRQPHPHRTSGSTAGGKAPRPDQLALGKSPDPRRGRIGHYGPL